MYTKIVTITAVLFLITACAELGIGIESREAALDRTMASSWCAMTEAERNVTASARDYSDEFITWLNTRCD